MGRQRQWSKTQKSPNAVPHLIDEGADTDGAPLDEIQAGLVVLVVDKRPLQALHCILLLGGKESGRRQQRLGL